MPRIAVVEPDSIIALDIAKSIERERLAEVHLFYEANGILGDQKEQGYALFIVDIGDNQQSKIDEAIEIHREAGIYCLVISDHTVPTSLAKLREAEPLGILVKPFSSRELIANVEAALYRASMEKKLRDSERRYRNLFAYSLSARCVADHDGNIIERNKAFESHFPATGRIENIKDMFQEGKEWSKILDTLQRDHVFQEEILTRDVGQGQRDLICNFSFFQEELNKIDILCEFVDITESKHLREELFQSQKMEAMGRLASGVAHDLNNFLTSIMGFLEMVKMELPEDHAALEDVHGIERVIQKASVLTRQLLGFSRPKSYSPGVIDLRETLNDSFKILRRLVPERISFSLSMPDEPVLVNVDASHIEQIMLNLVVNSRDALERIENPRISIQLDLREDIVSQRRGYAVIKVKDNGTGIDPQHVTKIFEPFFTTKEIGKGTGLGLSIVKSLTEMNGGRITVESELGEGTVFSIEIPSQQRSESFNDPVKPRESSSAILGDEVSKILRGKRILIVDDDESVLEACKRILERGGADIETCVSAGEAILLAERMEFDLLVADVVLPGIYGTKLWTRLQKGNRIAACIFMTGHESHEVDLPSDVPLLRKPFDAQALVEAVARII
jgi:signal transduction histidine kinase